MSFSFGFYNAFDHDRRYDALQVSMIFDGIITDGVYATFLDGFRVDPSELDDTVLVRPGRAWFHHSWNYNDSGLPLEGPQSDLINDRWDAIVIEVNSDEDDRINSIKWIKGDISGSPQKPVMIRTETLNQYPLAYVYRKANSPKIGLADIEDSRGTDECPFVTGVLKTIDSDDLIRQWRAKWDLFYDASENQFSQFMADSNGEFEQFIDTSDTRFDTFMTDSGNSFNQFIADSNTKVSDTINSFNQSFDQFMTDSDTEFDTFMDDSKTSFDKLVKDSGTEFNEFMDTSKSSYDTWFNETKKLLSDFYNNSNTEFQNWLTGVKATFNTFYTDSQKEFQDWFDSIKDIFNEETVKNLQSQIDTLNSGKQDKLIFPLLINQGGTGKTTSKDAANTLLSGLETSEAAGGTGWGDDNRFVVQGTGTYSDRFFTKPTSFLFNWIKNKLKPSDIGALPLTGGIITGRVTGLVSNAHYSMSDNLGTGYYKIAINSTASWMLGFTIRVYQNYRLSDIVISGYNYGTNYWYQPEAILEGDSDNLSITVTFGYDSANHLWVAIPAHAYTGLDILNVTSGYANFVIDYGNLFTITRVDALTGTTQLTTTVYPPLANNKAAIGLVANRVVNVSPAGVPGRTVYAYLATTSGLTQHINTGTDYVDFLVLNSWDDTTAGKINALSFDKRAQNIKHYQGTYHSDSWDNPKTLAYTDSTVAHAITSGMLKSGPRTSTSNFYYIGNIDCNSLNNPGNIITALSETLKWICTTYPDVTGGMFVGTTTYTSSADGISYTNPFTVYIRATNNSSNNIPFYSSGICEDVDGLIINFGSQNYTFRYNLSTDIDSLHNKNSTTGHFYYVGHLSHNTISNPTTINNTLSETLKWICKNYDATNAIFSGSAEMYNGNVVTVLAFYVFIVATASSHAFSSGLPATSIGLCLNSGGMAARHYIFGTAGASTFFNIISTT